MIEIYYIDNPERDKKADRILINEKYITHCSRSKNSLSIYFIGKDGLLIQDGIEHLPYTTLEEIYRKIRGIVREDE